jgi:hypothetical protein
MNELDYKCENCETWLNSENTEPVEDVYYCDDCMKDMDWSIQGTRE